MISVTLIGALSGIARLTRPMGSRKLKDALLNRLSSSFVSQALQSNTELSLRGKISRARISLKEAGDEIAVRFFLELTVKEED